MGDGSVLERVAAIVPDREVMLDVRVRAAGLVVLLLWSFHFVRYVWVLGTPDQMLWMCHTATLTLGVGLVASSASAVRVGALWSLGGFPLWIFDVIVRGETTRVSVLSHILVPIIGVASLTQVRWRGRPVLGAFMLYAASWLCARFFGTPQGNVNLSHQVYDLFGAGVVGFWLYLAVTATAMMGFLAVISLVLGRAFAPTREFLELLSEPARIAEAEPEAPAVDENAEPGFRLAPRVSPQDRKAWQEQRRRAAVLPASAAPPVPRGFTLLEMMVVVAILGILAAIAVPDLTPAVHNAKLRAQLDEVASFVENARRRARAEGRCYRVVQTGANFEMQRRANADCVTPIGGPLSGGGWEATASTLRPQPNFSFTLQSVPTELVFRPSGRVRGDGDLDVVDDGARIIVQYAFLPTKYVEILITSQGRQCPTIQGGVPGGFSAPVICGTGFAGGGGAAPAAAAGAPGGGFGGFGGCG